MIITDEQLSTALDEIHICDPDTAALCEDVLELLERKGDEAAVEEWVGLIVKASAGPRAVAAIKVQAQAKLDQAQQPAARPSRQRERPAREPAREHESDWADEVAPRTNGPKRVLGIIAWCFGALLWVPGSRYALDGWTLGINVVLGVAHIDFAVPMAVGRWSLLLFVVGFLYSVGEQKYIPVRIYRTRAGWRWAFLGWGVVLIWLIINGTDAGATYLGATVPAPNAWPITLWMIATPWASVTWTLVLTYIPELFFLLGAHWMGIRIQWPWNRRKRG